MLCLFMSLVYKEITSRQTPLHNAQDKVKLDLGLAYWWNVRSLLIFKVNDVLVGLRFNVTFCMVQYYCPSDMWTILCLVLAITLLMQSWFYHDFFQGLLCNVMTIKDFQYMKGHIYYLHGNKIILKHIIMAS